MKFWSIKFSIGCYQEALFDSDLLLNLRIKVGTIDKRQKTGEHSQRTPNKLTNELRSALKNALFDEIEQLPSRLDELEVKDRVELTIKLMPYVMPKVDTIDSTSGEPLDLGW